MEVLQSPSFLITFAIIQTFVLAWLIRALAIYEYEPMSALNLMLLWGAVGATSLSVVGDSFVRGLLPPLTQVVFGSAIASPLTEELAKGAALLAAFLASAWLRKRFGLLQLRGLTDGIVYGAAIGLGFAFSEDLHYLVDSGAGSTGLDIFTFLSRRDFFGIGALHHAVYTAAVGGGLGVATWSRRWSSRAAFFGVGLLSAIVLHAANNGLVNVVLTIRFGFDAAASWVSSPNGQGVPREIVRTAEMSYKVMALVDYFVIVGFVGIIALWLVHQKRIIERELQEEVNSGLINARDVEVLSSYLKRMSWYLALIRVGEVERYRVVRRLHTELAELAFTKWHAKKQRRSDSEILGSRQRIANLKAETEVDVYAPVVARDQA